jgi:hypothetical protein
MSKTHVALGTALGLVLWMVNPLHAQFTISTSVTGSQILNATTGTVTSTGSITLGGGNTAVFMSGAGAILNNSGTISQTATARTIRFTGTNTQITNNSSGIIQSAGQDAIQANGVATSSITLTNAGTIQATGGQALDFRDITSGNNSITNTGNIFATGEDAIRPGTNGTVINSGIIRATPVSGSGSDGIDTGTRAGVQVTNTGTISGRHGITGGDTNYNIIITNNNGGLIRGVNGSGVNIDGIFSTAAASVTNRGTIEGLWDGVSANGDGDGVDVDGVLSLNNFGIVRGLGANGVDSGGQPNGADGVAAGGGTITNHAGAEIYGRMDAGDGSLKGKGILVDNGAGGAGVAVTNVTNAGLIRGYTGYAIKMVGTFNDTITNQVGGVIRGNDGALGAAIQTGDGDDRVTNSGTITGDNGVAVDLEDGNDTFILFEGTAQVNGSVNGGAGSDTLRFQVISGGTFTSNGTFNSFSSTEVESGTVNLLSANDLSGTTTVKEEATLLVNNTSGSATGTSAVTVEAGGTLGGTGILQGPVSILAGAALAPGNSPGTLTLTSGLTLVDDSILNMELGTNSDLLAVTGGLTFSGAGEVVVNIANSGGLALATYTLVQFDSLTGFDLTHVTLGNTPLGVTGTFGLGSNALTFTVTSVPEPSTYLLLVLGLTAVMGCHRLRMVKGR